MSTFKVNTDCLDRESSSIIQLAKVLREYNDVVTGISSNLGMNVLAREHLDITLKEINSQIFSEAAKMESLGDALVKIAEKYKETETKLIDSCNVSAVSLEMVSISDKQMASSTKLVQFRLWLLEHGIVKAKSPKRKEEVTIYQEREMDLYMQQEIAKIRKNKRFSKKTWEKASTEERKQILQEFIEEVAKIMGLPAVPIIWGPDEVLEVPKEPVNGHITTAFYADKKGLLYINDWIIESGDDNGVPSYYLFTSAVHEMRHYYQHQAVKHPDKYVVTVDTINSWERDFNLYIFPQMAEDGIQTYEFNAYQDQTIEVDARRFAGEE